MLLGLQMGHTGRPPSPGSVGTDGEQDLTRRIGAAVAAGLNRDAWHVRVMLADPGAAAYRGLDAFVAVHGDGSLSPLRRGASLGFQTDEGRELATAIRAAYTAHEWPGGWNPNNYTQNLAQYYGVRAAVAAGCKRAVIWEVGTLTNQHDRAILSASSGVARIVGTLAAALGIGTPAPGPGTPPRRPWPGLPAGHYFGLITGPNASHGGYYLHERPHVQLIQQWLIYRGFVPGIRDWRSGWADGLFHRQTFDAVAAFQRAMLASTTSRYGEVWADDWAALIGT